MKHRSFEIYFLTPTAKTTGDTIWRVVLVGRYPWGRRTMRNERGTRGSPNCLCLQTMAPPEVLSTSKQINYRGTFASNRDRKVNYMLENLV